MKNPDPISFFELNQAIAGRILSEIIKLENTILYHSRVIVRTENNLIWLINVS